MVLYTFDQRQSEFRFEAAMRPHPREASLEDNRFGSLNKYAEVWNMCLSPCGGFIATCSEDQSTRITRLDTEQVEYQFGGHSTAVTDVDWKVESESGREFLVTCADDCRVLMHLSNDRRPNSRKKWVFFRVFNSRVVDQAWHTLTYMRLLPKMRFVVAVSQNGFLLVWNYSEKVGRRLVFGKKVHFGSIEGLDVIPSSDPSEMIVCTTGSDCTVGLFRLKIPKST